MYFTEKCNKNDEVSGSYSLIGHFTVLKHFQKKIRKAEILVLLQAVSRNYLSFDDNIDSVPVF